MFVNTTTTYDTERSLADWVSCGNGTSIKHEYDDADRVDMIGHRTESTQFLVLDYDYDDRGRIDRITETEGGTTTEVDYTYDDRGRLTGEKRCTPDCADPTETVFDIEYHYDQGGNRLYKFNHQANRVTDYHYDLGNNRLTDYEVREINGDNVYERVVYDYFHADDKAGNVRRVARMVPDVPGPDPYNWTVYGTDFDYHRNSEVRMIVQRTWRDDGGAVSDDELVSIHEVRGSGRTRYMLRPWYFAPDGQCGWNTWADNASALWTAYDGEEPTVDYRMIDHPTLGLVPYPETSYTLGLAHRTPDGEVKYFHTDHLGTTQAMTDASQAVNPRIVYTAFGEVISTDGTVDTRYQYAGLHGYETIGTLPFLHIGYRWYDASSGRFLQRDPIGIAGGFNAYDYAFAAPMEYVDPLGLIGLSPNPPPRNDIERGIRNKAIERQTELLAAVADGYSPIPFLNLFERLGVYDSTTDAGAKLTREVASWLSYCGMARKMAKGIKRIVEKIRPANPPAYVSPLPPMQKGPFIGGMPYY